MTPGRLIRSVRERRRLSQSQLALRAGTRQSAVSRLERDEISPSVETLNTYLNVMGEELCLSSKPVRRDYDPLHRRASARLSPEKRLKQAISWNRMAGEFAAAGRKARAKKPDA